MSKFVYVVGAWYGLYGCGGYNPEVVFLKKEDAQKYVDEKNKPQTVHIRKIFKKITK